MPLEKSIIEVNLGGKRSDAVDANVMGTSGVWESENALYDKAGAADKATGNTPLTYTLDGRNSAYRLSDPHMFEHIGGSPVCAAKVVHGAQPEMQDDYYPFFRHSNAAGRWSRSGILPDIDNTYDRITSLAQSGSSGHYRAVSHPDMVETASYQVYTYSVQSATGGPGNIYVGVKDLLTGAKIKEILLVTVTNDISAVSLVAVDATNNKVHLFYREDVGVGTVHGWLIVAPELTATNMALAIAGDAFDADAYVDTTHGKCSALVARDAVAVTIYCIDIDAAYIKRTVAIGAYASLFISVRTFTTAVGTPTSKIAVAFDDPATRSVIYTIRSVADLSALVAPFSAVSYAVGSSIVRVCVSKCNVYTNVVSSSTDVIRIWHTVGVGAVPPVPVYFFTTSMIVRTDLGLAPITGDECIPNWILSSKAHMYDSRSYVWMSRFTDGLDSFTSALFTVWKYSGSATTSWELFPVAVANVWSEALNSSINLPNMVSDPIYKHLRAAAMEEVTAPDHDLGRRELIIRGVDFDKPRQRSVAKSADGSALVVAGRVYSIHQDGCTPHGFLHRPVIGCATATVGAGLADATYNYIAVFEYMDGNGNIERSYPSPAVQVTTAAPNNQVTLYVERYHLDKNIKKVVVALYRQDPGAEYLYVGSFSCGASFFSAPAAAGVWAIFIDSAASVAGKALLFSSGAVGEYRAPTPIPSPVEVDFHRGRFFLTSAHDKGTVYYSHQMQQDKSAEFNLDANRTLPDSVNRVASAGSHLLCACERGMYTISGDGPDVTLSSGQFELPRYIPGSPGCGYGFFKAVVKSPIGVIINTDANWMIISQDGSVSPFGIDAIDSIAQVVSAAASSGQPEIWFHNAVDGVMYVYNYRFDRWTEQTLFSGSSKCVVSGYTTYGVSFINNSGYVLIPGSGYVRGSGGTSYNLKAATAWLNVSSVQALQRVWWVNVLGSWGTGVTGTVKLYYDGNSAAEQTVTFTAGSYSAYDGTVLRIKPSRQKCRSIRVEAYGATKLISVQLVCGMKSPKGTHYAHRG